MGNPFRSQSCHRVYFSNVNLKLVTLQRIVWDLMSLALDQDRLCDRVRLRPRRQGVAGLRACR